MELKVGDTVRLKSGGPCMTVRSVDGKDVICNWFAGERLEQEVFIQEALERSEPTAPYVGGTAVPRR